MLILTGAKVTTKRVTAGKTVILKGESMIHVRLVLDRVDVLRFLLKTTLRNFYRKNKEPENHYNNCIV